MHKIDYSGREFSLDAFQQELSAQKDMIKTLAGKGTIWFDSEEYSESVNVKIYIQYPDSLLILFEGPFGIDMARIFISEREILYYNINENIFYRGEYNSRNLALLTGAKLKFVEVIELFGGDIRFFPISDKIHITKGVKEYIAVSEVDDGYEEYYIDRKIWHITKYVKRDREKNILAEKKFKSFERTVNGYFPKVIKYIKPGEIITLFYKSINLNKKIDPGRFQIIVPESAEEIIL